MPNYTKNHYKTSFDAHQTEALIEELLLHLSRFFVQHRDARLEQYYDKLEVLLAQWKDIEQQVVSSSISSHAIIQQKKQVQQAVSKIIEDLPDYYFDVLNGKELAWILNREKPYGKYIVNLVLGAYVIFMFFVVVNTFFSPSPVAIEETTTESVLTEPQRNKVIALDSQELTEKEQQQQAALATTVKSIEENMVELPSGFFTMGCVEHPELCDEDEKPAHEVFIRSFKISKYEITQKDWYNIMEKKPSYRVDCDNCPVEQINKEDIKKFLSKLYLASGKQYRLPSETEWEYAARGGEAFTYAGSDTLNSIAWYQSNADSIVHPVGQKQANGFGLYDMSGNVYEWCQDDWEESYIGAPTDNSAVNIRHGKGVIRGGSWDVPAKYSRVSNRSGIHDHNKSYDVGFRLAQ